LIQRIKFLIDKIAIEENLPKKFASSKPKLLDQNRSWVFYSPSELLSLYLQSNMQKEGLNPHEKVKVWSQELEILVRQYKLVNTELQRPFLFYNDPEAGMLFPLDGKGIKSIISNFESFYLKVQNDRFSRLKSLNVKGLSWEKQAKEIIAFIGSYGEIKEFESLIRLYFNIRELYQAQVSEILKDYNAIISKAAALTQVELSKSETNNQNAVTLLENWKQKISSAAEEDDNEDEEELEDEDFDDNDSQESNIQGRILKKIRIIIRKSALLPFDATIRLTPKEVEFKALLSDLTTLEKFNEIGQLAYFKKHFERNTKGVARNLFSVIPTYYKKYRRSRLKAGFENWNLPLLKSIIERNNNKRIHKEEQAFLLYFINKLIKLTYSSFEQPSSEIKHPYFEAFRQHTKPVIAIDEATDFHLIDLLAMSSLSDPKTSSVTYSGDLMQRMTNNGLRAWKD
jgi:hypothetical protein